MKSKFKIEIQDTKRNVCKWNQNETKDEYYLKRINKRKTFEKTIQIDAKNKNTFYSSINNKVYTPTVTPIAKDNVNQIIKFSNESQESIPSNEDTTEQKTQKTKKKRKKSWSTKRKFILINNDFDYNGKQYEDKESLLTEFDGIKQYEQKTKCFNVEKEMLIYVLDDDWNNENKIDDSINDILNLEISRFTCLVKGNQIVCGWDKFFKKIIKHTQFRKNGVKIIDIKDIQYALEEYLKKHKIENEFGIIKETKNFYEVFDKACLWKTYSVRKNQLQNAALLNIWNKDNPPTIYKQLEYLKKQKNNDDNKQQKNNDDNKQQSDDNNKPKQ